MGVYDTHYLSFLYMAQNLHGQTEEELSFKAFYTTWNAFSFVSLFDF